MQMDVDKKIAAMVNAIRELEKDKQLSELVMVGIHTGGTWVAAKLHEQLGWQTPLGELNISFYRDDFTRVGFNPEVKPSNLPTEIDDKHILLVDDVLHTGRTIRAALNELFDYGRPASIHLAVLVQREGRELPIQPDVVGETVELADDEHIKLTGPDPMSFVIQKGPRN